MNTTRKDLPIVTFEDSTELRAWLMTHHQKSEGVWVRIYKTNSGIVSVTFEEVLIEGLCFGWSESLGATACGCRRFAPSLMSGVTRDR